MQKILLGKAADVPPGKGKTFVTQGKAVVVANLKGEIKAYENKCPHMGGSVRYDGERKFVCSWHGAQFEVGTGENIIGAEGQRLKSLNVVLEGEDLYWLREEEKSPWADNFD